MHLNLKISIYKILTWWLVKIVIDYYNNMSLLHNFFVQQSPLFPQWLMYFKGTFKATEFIIIITFIFRLLGKPLILLFKALPLPAFPFSEYNIVMSFLVYLLAHPTAEMQIF